MENTTYISLSRQSVLNTKMSAIANNLANMNTTGYKNERVQFVNFITKSRSSDFAGDQSYTFVRAASNFRDTSTGPIEQTGNTLDVAINGDGFFAVQGKDGTEQYTRNGHFRMDATGQLVTQSGLPVLTDAGTPIFFTSADTAINIAGDGTVSSANGPIGKLQIVTFDKPGEMLRLGAGLYSTDQQPTTKANPDIMQGGLEGSNVISIMEMTRMIEVSRSYSGAQKLIDREDQRIRKVIQELAAPVR